VGNALHWPAFGGMQVNTIGAQRAAAHEVTVSAGIVASVAR
jgi:hypothetical protein